MSKLDDFNAALTVLNGNVALLVARPTGDASAPALAADEAGLEAGTTAINALNDTIVAKLNEAPPPAPAA